MYNLLMKQKTKFIGIDLGGTKIVLEAFDGEMKQVVRTKEKTDSKSQKTVLDQIYRLIDQVIKPSTKAIGIAVPGPVNTIKGIVANTPHLPLKKNLGLRNLLKKRYKIPVWLDNDINTFLFAESKRTRLKKMNTLVGVMIGTGVGGSIMIDGKMLHGKNGYAGEVGHMIIDQSAKWGSLEQKSSGSFISKLAKSLGIKEVVTTYDLDKNTTEAKKVKQSLIENVGIGLANLNLIFNPDAFVLGGSIYHLFLAEHKGELKKIIGQHAMDSKSPPLINGQKKTSAAKGVAMMAKDRF